MTEGIIKKVQGTRTDTEMRFRVGHGNAFLCQEEPSVSSAPKNLCSQKDGLGNAFPCWTRKCVPVSGRVVYKLCTQKICAVKRMEPETCLRIGHGNVIPCLDSHTRKCVSVSGRVVCELCTQKICAVKRMDTEMRVRVGHGNGGRGKKIRWRQ